MRKVTRANELFSTINYKQAEIELCDCGEDAVGTNIHGRPACKIHSAPHDPFEPIEDLPVWEITPEDARLAKKQRYANESSLPWPESIEKLIDHMSIYHHGQIKDIVTHFTNMVDELGDVVPKGKRTTLINELIKAQLTGAVETGAIKPTHALAEHEYLHGGRTDGPDRGHAFIPVKGPEEDQRLRALIDHEHTTIPEIIPEM